MNFIVLDTKYKINSSAKKIIIDKLFLAIFAYLSSPNMFNLYSYAVFYHRNIELSHLGTGACVMRDFICRIIENEMLWREMGVYLVVWIIRALKPHIKTKYHDVYNTTKISCTCIQPFECKCKCSFQS